jgi:hypothetical protein
MLQLLGFELRQLILVDIRHGDAAHESPNRHCADENQQNDFQVQARATM